MPEKKVKILSQSPIVPGTKNSKVKIKTKTAKVEKKVVAKKAVVSKDKKITKAEYVKATNSVETANAGMTIDVFGINGKKAGTMKLPEEVFGVKVNKELIAQAVRVYRTNQRKGTASTKTRGEVAYSTRKIYRQKGTGRARHGDRGAPIFVKGGVAHGPKLKDYEKKLSKHMKKAAFVSALSAKAQDRAIIVVEGMSNIEPKTKVAAGMFENLSLPPKGRNALFILPGNLTNTLKALRNLTGVSITTADRANTYDILGAKKIMFMKESIEKIRERVNK